MTFNTPLGPLLLGLLITLIAGCTRTDCGEYDFFGTPAGEECGPYGSFGFIYIDEGLATVFFEPYRELGDTESPYFDSLPYWNLDFPDDALQPGTTMEMPDLLGYCSYFPQIGSGQGMYTFLATSARLEVISKTRRKNTGGFIYRLEWEIDCEIGKSRGNDLIELAPLSQGYEGNAWGWSPTASQESP